MRTTTRPRLVVPILVAGLVLTACGGDDATDATPSPIAWQPCTDLGTTAPLECATVQVPLDYDRPEGAQIEIAITRIAATDPARREGAILVNPGGPGASGRAATEAFGAVLAAAAPELAERFDLVGFDPRGVGASSPVRCVDDAWKDRYLLADTTPDDAAERADAAEQLRFGANCRTELGDTLAEYSTNNTARDMDRIRAALGDEQISYWGVSYGTLLGATYGGLFPDRVRVLVLDSAYSPDVAAEPELVMSIRGFQASFDAFATACAAAPACPFTAATAADVTQRWQTLADTLDTAPLDVDGRAVNRETMNLATYISMYSPTAWPDLAQALTDAEQGDGASVLSIADLVTGRAPDGTYDNQFDAQTVINCASDLAGPTGLDGADPTGLSPVLGRLLTLLDTMGWGCSDPAAVEPRASIEFTGAAPVVVIGGTGDAATPFAMAEQMVRDIGPRASLVVFEGEGHGQSLVDPCLAGVVTEALRTATAPPAGTVCSRPT